jgi:putative endonuclease
MARPADPARRRAERYGRRAETLAGLLLMAQGFRILERRLRGPGGEIDILARRGKLLVACEVKARRRDEAELVAPRQWQRIAAALDGYVARRAQLAGCDRRFDLIEIVAGHLPRHHRDVWRP